MSKRLSKRERRTVALVAAMLRRLEAAVTAAEERGGLAGELTLLRWRFVMNGRHGERLTELGVRKFADEEGRWRT